MNPATPLLVGLFALALISFLLILVVRYKRVPPGKLLVVYGKLGGGVTHLVIERGGHFVWPVIQDCAYLPLEPIRVDGATVRIGSDAAARDRAALHFVSLSEEQMAVRISALLAESGFPEDVAQTEAELRKAGLVLV